jgi:hypothetical protein
VLLLSLMQIELEKEFGGLLLEKEFGGLLLDKDETLEEGCEGYSIIE